MTCPTVYTEMKAETPTKPGLGASASLERGIDKDNISWGRFISLIRAYPGKLHISMDSLGSS